MITDDMLISAGALIISLIIDEIHIYVYYLVLFVGYYSSSYLLLMKIVTLGLDLLGSNSLIG